MEWIRNNKLLAALIGGGGLLLLYLLLRRPPPAADGDGGVLPLITPTAPFFAGGGTTFPEGAIAGGGPDRAPETGLLGPWPFRPGQQTDNADDQFAAEQMKREEAARRKMLELERQDTVRNTRERLTRAIADRRAALRRLEERIKPLAGLGGAEPTKLRRELRARLNQVRATLQGLIRERAVLG